MKGHVATAATSIAAAPELVWQALTDPAKVEQYFLGTRVESAWRVGAPITWSGEYQGRAYTDHGRITAFEPGRLLEFTHFSPLSGLPDLPDNHHLVRFELAPAADGTDVRLSQDGNADAAEAQHATATWQQVLDGLKRVVEAG